MPVNGEILLVAVNARYSHCSHAARSLAANLGGLASRAAILETDLDVTPLQLAERVAAHRPRVVGFCTYLWNVRLVEACARILRCVRPQLRLAAGGPEITADYPHAALFDAIVLGEGESAWRTLCESWLPSDTRTAAPPAAQAPHAENLATLTLPDALYTDTDLAQRTVYVEASRGCPYACAYCTSAGTGLRLFPLDRLLPSLDRLWRRGLRRYKFLDRSFNAPAGHACAVLDFFRDRVTPDTCLHLEINPDRLHPDVAARLASFPRGALHLEAGVQTLNPSVSAAIGRSPDTAQTLANMRFLSQGTGATLHADLIFGLPGEDAASFSRGFNTLVEACRPPELQINLLKGLPGTRLAREAGPLGLVFNPEPPYELLRSDALSFDALLQLQHVARTWELIHNRGRFPRTVAALRDHAGSDTFGAYARLAAHIQAAEGRFHALGLSRLARLVGDHLVSSCGFPRPAAEALVEADLNGSPHAR